MCGIFALFNNEIFSKEFIKENFEKGQKRGPEHSIIVDNVKSTFGFHRLSINGLNNNSNQPIIINNILLICNGEIYNYKELYKILDLNGTTQSDCEIIIHLYEKYGMEQTLNMIDGVFAFILLDNRIINNDLTSKCYIARDPFGVRPLFVLQSDEIAMKSSETKIIGFGSEIKVLSTIYSNLKENYSIKPFIPGTWSMYSLSNKVLCSWESLFVNKKYYIPHFPVTVINNNCYHNDILKMMENIRSNLNKAVIKRCITTERPIAALLSGGLDSSLVAALVSQYYNKTFGYNKLETYSIGLFGSEDLKHARIVAEYIGSIHKEIIVTEKEMFDAIPDVIYNIESYDTTTVRASIGNYLLGKYISKHSSAKVIFNGDGADEVCGGYLYMNYCPDAIEFDKETRRLLKDIHLFDVLRSDRCISSHGLEPRTPFLDKEFVDYYLSIPPFIRNNEYLKKKNILVMEKYLLRESFSYHNCYEVEGSKPLLPDVILWRKKEAFSDGVSTLKRSLFSILQDFISNKLEEDNIGLNLSLSLVEKEKLYYKTLFQKFYPNLDNIIPYYWMPKYTNATDPSARTLSIYSSTNDINSGDIENKLLNNDNIISPKLNVGLLMFYDDTIKEYGDINYRINKKYCEKYNIELIVSHEKSYKDRHPAWERLPLILKYIEKYDYLIWIDADAFFYKDAGNIIDIIEKNANIPFLFSKDVAIIIDRKEENINTGLFIIKNVPYSIEFLKLWAYDDNFYNNNPYPYWWDQGVFVFMYDNNILDIKNNSLCFNYGILQHFYNYELDNFTVKPFVWHLAGNEKEKRIEVSNEYWKTFYNE
jgi:asparagine synthase (glutamine-hydrolysing)